MIYLLDTNVAVEITTRPKPAPAVVAWARSVPAPALYLSVITVAEIEAGIQGTPDLVRRTAFERALADIRVISTATGSPPSERGRHSPASLFTGGSRVPGPASIHPMR
ncbi:PIN domain-containing protein [Streptomyces sp. NPDC060048]|uniref:PIN domain-containing protein n=1 Tax=unclassified Streptomyces TaxID=2593676 RepID=UPI0036A3CFF7